MGYAETMAMRLAGVGLLLLAAGAAQVSAGPGAHEHGVADLSVAIEGGRVDVMLTAPTYDLVGLERAPRRQQEREAVEARVQALEKGQWFAWPGTSCEQVAVHVELPEILLAAPTEPEDGTHHHGHDHHHHEHHDHDAAHMDGLVTWQYRCDPDERLRYVDVNLFDLLVLERIRAQTLSDHGQGAGRLTPDSRRLALP